MSFTNGEWTNDDSWESKPSDKHMAEHAAALTAFARGEYALVCELGESYARRWGGWDVAMMQIHSSLRTGKYIEAWDKAQFFGMAAGFRNWDRSCFMASIGCFPIDDLKALATNQGRKGQLGLVELMLQITIGMEDRPRFHVQEKDLNETSRNIFEAEMARRKDPTVNGTEAHVLLRLVKETQDMASPSFRRALIGGLAKNNECKSDAEGLLMIEAANQVIGIYDGENPHSPAFLWGSIYRHLVERLGPRAVSTILAAYEYTANYFSKGEWGRVAEFGTILLAGKDSLDSEKQGHVLEWLAEAWVELNDGQSAIEALQELETSTGPLTRHYKIRLGHAYRLIGDSEQALEVFTECLPTITEPVDHAFGLYHKAVAEYDIGLDNEATADLREAVNTIRDIDAIGPKDYSYVLDNLKANLEITGYWAKAQSIFDALEN